MTTLREWITRQTIGQADDFKEMGQRLAHEWGLTLGKLEVLHAGDPRAEDTLRAASEQLQVLTTTFGPMHGWTLAQHHVIYRTACRVWGPKQLIVSQPNWTESF